jgi:hypothetical protein
LAKFWESDKISILLPVPNNLKANRIIQYFNRKSIVIKILTEHWRRVYNLVWLTVLLGRHRFAGNPLGIDQAFKRKAGMPAAARFAL